MIASSVITLDQKIQKDILEKTSPSSPDRQVKAGVNSQAQLNNIEADGIFLLNAVSSYQKGVGMDGSGQSCSSPSDHIICKGGVSLATSVAEYFQEPICVGGCGSVSGLLIHPIDCAGGQNLDKGISDNPSAKGSAADNLKVQGQL